MKGELTNDLLEILGEADLLLLVENFAGCRLSVPSAFVNRAGTDTLGDRSTVRRSALAIALGEEATRKLSACFGGATLRVPLAREFRARHYRKQGMSNAKIAVRLGMTETGVDALFQRLRAARRASVANDNGRKPSSPPPKAPRR